jgi:hypothetical protein
MSAKREEEKDRDRPSSINELDDIKTAVKWMLKGRVDTKGFTKYFPHTSQDLRDGKVTPEQVTDGLSAVYATRETKLCQFVVMVALPTEFFRFLSTRRTRGDVCSAFYSDLKSNYTERIEKDITPQNSSILLQQSFDEVCEQRADRLDIILFRGRRGTFLNKCPLYDITPDSFHELVMSIPNANETDGQEDFRVCSILCATRNVVVGLQDLKRTCWECGNLSKDLKHCSKCSTAKYCSRECQVSQSGL